MEDEINKEKFINSFVDTLSQSMSSKHALIFGYILGEKFDKLEKNNIFNKLKQVTLYIIKIRNDFKDLIHDYEPSNYNILLFFELKLNQIKKKEEDFIENVNLSNEKNNNNFYQKIEIIPCLEVAFSYDNNKDLIHDKEMIVYPKLDNKFLYENNNNFVHKKDLILIQSQNLEINFSCENKNNSKKDFKISNHEIKLSYEKNIDFIRKKEPIQIPSPAINFSYVNDNNNNFLRKKHFKYFIKINQQ